MNLLERVREVLAPDYVIERELGAGGMGMVFLARDARLNRPVAVKLLDPAQATARAAEHFVREARILAQINHPHVVVVHDVVAEPEGRRGLHYFVMEYVEGETLDARIRQGPMPAAEVVHTGADLLDGLAAVHQAGIVHRDIKPANIFLADGRVKLGDFGIARTLEGSSTSGASSTGRRGTPDYLSPEQRHELPVTTRSDLYQMAAVLYEACTGRRWSEAEASPGTSWRAVPRRLRPVLRRGLAWEPDARWPDAGAFRRALLAAERDRLWVRAVAAVALVAAIGLSIRIARPLLLPAHCPAWSRVELTVLAFTGTDSAAATRLARYVGRPLDRFPRITTRPMSVASSLPRPRSPAEVACLATGRYAAGELSGDTLRLEVHDGESGRLLATFTVPRPSPAASPIAWGGAAADSLVHRFFYERYDTYRAVVGQGGSDDAMAVDEFLLGEEAYHHDEYLLAVEYFRRALDQDADFALAAWHLLLARRALRAQSVADVREVAARYGARLPALYRELLDIQLDEDLVRRFGRYRAVVTSFPEHRIARMLYADDLFHQGPLVGLPLDTALTELSRAAAIDPHRDLGPEQDHTIWANLRLGREADARAALQRRLESADRHAATGTREGRDRSRFWRLAFYERFEPGKGQLLRWWFLRSPDSTRLRQTEEYMRLALSMDLAATEIAFGEVVVRHAANDRSAALGHEAQGLGMIALGRPVAALAQFDSAALRFATRESAIERVQWRVLLPFMGVAFPESTVASGEEQLRVLVTDRAVGIRAAWTLLAAEVLRDEEPDPILLARVERAADLDQDARRLLQILEALVLARRRPAEAIARTDTLIRLVSIDRLGDPFARAILYFGRASWQAREGRSGEAVRTLLWHQQSDLSRWAQSEAQPYDVDLALSPIARLRLAVLLSQRGDRPAACALAGRVAELWHDAEPVMNDVRRDLTSLVEGCQP